MGHRVPLTVLLVTLGLSLDTGSARADAVPPPPEHCPKGKVPITSHAGPECIDEAPKDCAPGYRGALGARCVLATCATDAQCEGGQRCLQIETCQEYRELHWSGWGWEAKRAAPRDNLLAEPPMPQPDGPPKEAWVLLRICGQDGPCDPPAECRPAGLCYPPDQVGKTKATVVATGDAVPPPDSTSEVYVPSADVPSGHLGKRGRGDAATTIAGSSAPEAPETDAGGCRKGCAMASTLPLLGWIGVPLLVGVVVVRRSRRARTSRARSRRTVPVE
jgi:hypothetical protein